MFRGSSGRSRLLLQRIFKAAGYISTQGSQTSFQATAHLKDELNAHAEKGDVSLALESFHFLRPTLTRQDETMAYNTVLKAYAKAGDYGGARAWYDDMEKRGIRRNKKTYGKLVDAASKARLPKEAEVWLLRLLDSAQGDMTDFSAPLGAVLDGWAKALEDMRVMEWMRRGDEGGVACEGGAPFSLWRALPAGLANHAIEVLARHGNTAEAALWLDKIDRSDSERLMHAYHLLIGSCSVRGDIKAASEWFDKLKHCGLKPEVLHYNAMIGACARGHDPDSAKLWLDRIAEAGLQADVVSFSIVVEALAAAGAVQEAAGTLEVMTHKHGMVPNEVCYLHLIAAYANKNDMQFVAGCFERMASHGLTPSTAHFNAILSSPRVSQGLSASILSHIGVAGRDGSGEDAQLLEHMASVDAKPDVVTYTSLIKARTQSKEHQKLKQLLQKMCEARMEPDVMCNNAVLDGLVKAGDLRTAMQWFRTMESVCTGLDTVSYNIVIGGLASRGKIFEAAKVQESLKAQSVTPTLETYHALINGCAEARKPREASKWLKEMMAAAVQPSLETYNTLLKAWVRIDACEVAVEKLRHAMKASVEPSVVSYTTIISGFARRGNTLAGGLLIDEMQSRALQPDTICYNALLTGHSKAGDVQGGLDIMQRMERNDLSPDLFTWTSLLGACANADPPNRDKAEELCLKMISQGCAPSDVTYKMVDRVLGPQKREEIFAGVTPVRRNTTSKRKQAPLPKR